MLVFYIVGFGGIFKDMMIYDFDMVWYFFGDIVEVNVVGINVFLEIVE